MKKAKIADLKSNLSRYLDHVRGGQSVLVFDRDRLIAQIVPLRQSDRSTMENEPRLTRLKRKGSYAGAPGAFPPGSESGSRRAFTAASSPTF